MNQASNRWGVELIGAEQDNEVWQVLLKPPFDPFVEAVKDERGDYLALRSATFDGAADSRDVHELAKQLLGTLNVLMSKTADADPVRSGAVVEFVPDRQPRKHHFFEAETVTSRLRGGIVNATVTDAQGNVIEPPPAPSRAQRWLRAAAPSSEIGSALR